MENVSLLVYPQGQPRGFNLLLDPRHGARFKRLVLQCHPKGMHLAIGRRAIRSKPSTSIWLWNEKGIIIDGIDGKWQPLGLSSESGAGPGNGVDVIATQSSGTVRGEIENAILTQKGIALIESRVDGVPQGNRFTEPSGFHSDADQVPAIFAVLPEGAVNQQGVSIMKSHSPRLDLGIGFGTQIGRDRDQPQPGGFRSIESEGCVWICGDAIQHLQANRFVR